MGFPFPSPRNFIKLTRHRPQHNPFLPPSAPSDDPESVIVAAARRLDRGHWPLSQLGVFFCQVGDDGEAREALQELDDNLQTTYDIRVRPTAVAPRKVKNVERGLTSFSSIGHGGHDRLLSARERTLLRSGRQAPAQGVARGMEQTGRSKRVIGPPRRTIETRSFLFASLLLNDSIMFTNYQHYGCRCPVLESEDRRRMN